MRASNVCATRVGMGVGVGSKVRVGVGVRVGMGVRVGVGGAGGGDGKWLNGVPPKEWEMAQLLKRLKRFRRHHR